MLNVIQIILLGGQEIVLIVVLLASYIYSIYKVIMSSNTDMVKTIWIFSIVLFHFLGMLLFFLIGNKSIDENSTNLNKDFG